jgi:NAD-dependent dihydropyrimidine dehydrogenase PreA subunit
MHSLARTWSKIPLRLATLRRIALLKDSTRFCLREAKRLPGFSLFDALHGYVYARWPYLYIGTALGEHPLAKAFRRAYRSNAAIADGNGPGNGPSDRGQRFADAYHGKVISTRAATRLITIGKEIALPDLEPVIPYPKARDLILRNPDHIAVLQCPCRSVRTSPCLPLDVCLIIGDPFAGFILEHHPRKSRRVSVDEAVAILKAEHERGHVHHAFFKDAMLGRFYAICNCCSCCCGAMQAMRNGVPMLCSSGYVAQVNWELCKGCGACAEACPFGAAQCGRKAVIDPLACMGCGVCVDKCPTSALSLFRDPTKSAPLDVDALLEPDSAAP